MASADCHPLLRASRVAPLMDESFTLLARRTARNGKN
jgi:hypothetical protein